MKKHKHVKVQQNQRFQHRLKWLTTTTAHRYLLGLFTILAIALPTRVLAQQEGTSGGFLALLDSIFSAIVSFLAKIFFFEIAGFPFIVVWLIVAGIFFTIRLGFVNIRSFKHALDVVQGKYDNPDDEGDVSHFQALATALSGTVGLGNIAGVAVAIQTGGPGAVLWMTLGGFFGMTSKFTECTLALKYRRIREDGQVDGGPMYFLSRGLSDRGMRPLGQGLAVLFSILCIFACLGGGNMFQANQSYAAVAEVIPIPSWGYGIIVAAIVAVVIIGGISRIAAVTSKLVPTMAIIYIVACLWIILTNLSELPGAFGTIFSQAFSPQAVGGGIVGVIVQGIRRSGFSNEAGIGSAAIAHSAARTDEPVREGIVALLEPFIDTIVICNMTALVIVITGVYQSELEGAQLTSEAFGQVIGWFPIILAIAVTLFAFSTMISWSYYGEKAWGYLFSDRSVIVFKILFVACVFLGTVVNLQAVIDFSDMMLLAMAFPNLLGCYFLSGEVTADLKDYLQRLDAGEMLTYQDN
ncbi:MAG: alanine:cation symporter family protein [Symploca sp. SIO2C1]|nr:alanine:cation symporter family protein [Symploca sp. SIO2C1]